MIQDPGKVITPHQLELIALLANGYNLNQIAGMKFMSYSAAKQALQRAKENAGARNLTHLCTLCMEHGLLVRAGLAYIPVQEDGVRG